MILRRGPLWRCHAVENTDEHLRAPNARSGQQYSQQPFQPSLRGLQHKAHEHCDDPSSQWPTPPIDSPEGEGGRGGDVGPDSDAALGGVGRLDAGWPRGGGGSDHEAAGLAVGKRAGLPGEASGEGRDQDHHQAGTDGASGAAVALLTLAAWCAGRGRCT